jgi:uncharacterized membrane protein
MPAACHDSRRMPAAEDSVPGQNPELVPGRFLTPPIRRTPNTERFGDSAPTWLAAPLHGRGACTSTFLIGTCAHRDLHLLRMRQFQRVRVANRLKCLGKAPLCNMKAERGLRYGHFVFPLCARCTGLVGGALVRACLVAAGSLINLPPLAVVLLVVPLSLDAGLQYMFGLVSTNHRRIITGFLGGFGLGGPGFTISA